MLHTNFYIVTIQQFDNESIQYTEGVIALSVNSENISRFYSLASVLNITFCIYVENSSSVDKLSAQIVPFFFLTTYYNVMQCPVILAGCANDNGFTALHGTVLQHATLQGFKKLYFRHVLMDNTKGNQAFFAENQQGIAGAYKLLLHSQDAEAHGLYIITKQLVEISNLNKLLIQEEKEFEKEDLLSFKIKIQLKQALESNAQLQMLLVSAEEELANQKSHNVLLKSDTQTFHLQNYYNNEYEILPKWYKKLAQVIKVLSGKRSLKSLSNKSVKKYKD